jgi:hypothetical protein
MDDAGLINKPDFWNMQRGQRAVYHRGFLALDREKNAELDDMAAQAWRLAEKGVLLLTQRRHGELDYDYIAQRR